MAPFKSRGKFIALASTNSAILIDTSTGSSLCASIPRLPHECLEKSDKTEKVEKPVSGDSTLNPEDFSHLDTGTCLAFSRCLSYLAVCTPNKNLTVWKTPSLELVKQWTTVRKVSAISFNARGDKLVVADKAGDCYLYSLLEPDGSGKLILGHLSMLLDVAVSSDDKYILTSERDEKIRVSCYPNSYNIHTYCLGHTEFVTSLAIVSNSLVLSGSGDGTIRLWDYVNGKLLHTENVAPPGAGEMEAAVRCMAIYEIDETAILAAVILNKGKTVMIYEIKTKEAPVFRFELQTLPFSSSPLAMAFLSDGNLLILIDDMDQPVKFFTRGVNNYYVLEESALVRTLLDSHLVVVQDCVRSCNGDLKPLFKRWFDNVQAFRERKNSKGSQPRNGTSSSPKRPRIE